MSPEQAKESRPTSAATYGLSDRVLTKCVPAGGACQTAEDLTDVVRAVVRGEPDWTALPSDVPGARTHADKGCLQKDRKRASATLPWSVICSTMEPSLRPRNLRLLPRSLDRARETALVAATVPVALASSLWPCMVATWGAAPGTHSRTPDRRHRPRRSLVDVFGASSILLRRNGARGYRKRHLSQVNVSLYVRRLNQLRATQLAGTEGALNPFFSPDGKSIGFFAGGKLKKIAVAGGPAITLCDAPIGRGGSWGDAGRIVFAPSSAAGTALQRVSSEGGTPEKLFAIADGEANQRWPQVLPGGKAVIFTSPKIVGDLESSILRRRCLTSDKVLINHGITDATCDRTLDIFS